MIIQARNRARNRIPMVHLAAVSHFSILRGVHSSKALCRAAKALGYRSLAIADLNNLYGLPDFLLACAQHNIRPIIASEINCLQGNSSALLYAKGDEGFASLCRVITERHCDPKFDLVQSVTRCNDGLYAVSSNQELLGRFREKLPVFYRMSRPRRPPRWVGAEGYACVIAPQAAFLQETDFHTHRLLRAIDTQTTLSRLQERECLPSDAVFLSPARLADRFEVFEKELDTTNEFIEAVRSRTDFGVPIMPRFESEMPSLKLLRIKAFDGARQRYGAITDPVRQRLDYELDMIGRKGFASYFLVVDDIVRQSPRTCGRGSGAASAVAYCLGITNVDPIRYNLMFERFINPGRKDPPDIDVDFAWDERDDVIDYVFRKYGRERAAMVATHQTFGGRMAIREVARVYGLTEAEISEVSKRFPYISVDEEAAFDLAAIMAAHPKTRRLNLDPPWPQILADARQVLGKPRGIGTHCGGVIITPGPINRHAPVQISAKGVPIIQWEKDGAEEMGLVKIDLLGNRSLAVIRDALANVRREGVQLNENQWDPASDPKTVAMLATGKTMGVFYVESPATRLLQEKSGHGDFDHLVIHSSIIRPAANKLINEYLRRLHGGRWTPEHPVLAQALAETYGIMVYQEDVARVAMALAGFSFVEADGLRKVMAKKDRHNRLRDYQKRFFEGAIKRGVARETVERVWRMCLSFSGYSFCKPHSASYVQVSFQSAWLKAHYPAAFMAAVISNYGGFYVTQAYVSEAQRLGVSVLEPDINDSVDRYFSRGMAIRVGLCQIKGLSERARRRIVEKREVGGKYTSMVDFLERTGIEEPDAERLVLAGACDTVESEDNRPRLFWIMRCFYRNSRGDNELPRLKQYSRARMLRAQYATLGFLTAVHPITLIACPVRNVIKIKDIRKHYGKRVIFFGWCITSKTVSTKFGESMQFVTFEDETGLAETVLFPEAYQRFVHVLGWKEAFVVSGTVAWEYGAVSVEVDDIRGGR